jgi:hypothetical protein
MGLHARSLPTSIFQTLLNYLKSLLKKIDINPFPGPSGKNSLLERRPRRTEKFIIKMRKLVHGRTGSGRGDGTVGQSHGWSMLFPVHMQEIL